MLSEPTTPLQMLHAVVTLATQRANRLQTTSLRSPQLLITVDETACFTTSGHMPIAKRSHRATSADHASKNYAAPR